MEIVEITDSKGFRAFVRFNIQHYARNSGYIHPLLLALKDTFDFQRNPFWKTVDSRFFMLMQNKKAIGRIAVILPKSSVTAHFGFFECVNDPAAARLLFSAVEQVVRAFRRPVVTGPYNPSINYELGVLTEGFAYEPYFMMTYNHAYYDTLLTACGYAKAHDFYSYLIVPTQFVRHDTFVRVLQRTQQNACIQLRHPDLKNLAQEIDLFFEIYNNAFDGHYGFEPFDKEEFRFMAKDFAAVMNPEFCLLAYVDGQPAGFILALPNLNEAAQYLRHGKLFSLGIIRFLWRKSRPQTLRLINVAIKKEYGQHGLGAVLYDALQQKVQAAGIARVQLSWVAESNLAMNKIIRGFGATPENVYRIYEKQL